MNSKHHKNDPFQVANQLLVAATGEIYMTTQAVLSLHYLVFHYHICGYYNVQTTSAVERCRHLICHLSTFRRFSHCLSSQIYDIIHIYYLIIFQNKIVISLRQLPIKRHARVDFLVIQLFLFSFSFHNRIIYSAPQKNRLEITLTQKKSCFLIKFFVKNIISYYCHQHLWDNTDIHHCVKIVQIRSFFWSVFSFIRTKYRNTVFSPNTGKYGPEKTPFLDTFHAVHEHQVYCYSLTVSFNLNLISK